jgi:hypothetical protein
MTFLRRKQSEWASPVLYGLGTVCVLLVIFFTLVGRPLISCQEPATTPKNVEAHLQDWLKDTGAGIRDISSDEPNDDFAIQLSLLNGTSIIVSRSKIRDRYITLAAVIGFTDPKQKALFLKLSEDERADFLRDIVIEMNRERIECLVQPDFDGTINLRKTMLISSMTNESFLSSIQDVNFAVVLTEATMQRGLSERHESKLQSMTQTRYR